MSKWIARYTVTSREVEFTESSYTAAKRKAEAECKDGESVRVYFQGREEQEKVIL